MDAIAEAAGESLAEGTSAAGRPTPVEPGLLPLSPSALRRFGQRRGRFIWGRFSLRFGTRGLEILSGFRRVEPRQRRAQGIKARRVRISVAFDDATDCRCYRGQLVVGEMNCRHGPNIIGRETVCSA
jgi:hypothetical protein